MEISEKKLMGIRVTVHRGTNQIGGCVTEYECRGFHLFVDYGEQLPGYEHTDLEIEGLTKGNVSNSALLITRYHGDHIGKVSDLSNEIPIYMGKTGCEIYREFELHMAHIPGEEGERHRLMADRVGKFRHFEAGHPFKVGPFKIIPIVMDHSAFDAYAFKIEADGSKVFHTGDFRTHGFRSKTLPTVIEKYIGKVDCVVSIPIHTNSQEKFATAFPSWHVKLLEDGEIFSTNPFGDIPVHEEGDTILSAFCISENLESDDDLKISSVDEKFKCWKLDYKDVSSFNNSEQARDALKYVRAGKNVIAFEIWEECDFALTIGEVYRRDKTFYANLDSKSHFASRETALAIMRLPSSWYLVPVEVMGPATKEALKKVYDEGLLNIIGVSDFDEFYEQYEPVAYYEPNMIVKPLVDIETFEGKVLCELVSARYLFPMDVVEHRESKSLESVYPEIAKAPLPTTGEVEAILARFKAGEQGADEELKHACIRFVASVAKQFVGRGLSPEELLSIGIEGVLDAARNDQLSSGVSFQKYMIVYVKQAIVDAITHR